LIVLFNIPNPKWLFCSLSNRLDRCCAACR